MVGRRGRCSLPPLPHNRHGGYGALRNSLCGGDPVHSTIKRVCTAASVPPPACAEGRHAVDHGAGFRTAPAPPDDDSVSLSRAFGRTIACPDEAGSDRLYPDRCSPHIEALQRGNRAARKACAPAHWSSRPPTFSRSAFLPFCRLAVRRCGRGSCAHIKSVFRRRKRAT